MVKNGNFGQKLKFWSKIEILVKNRNFGETFGTFKNIKFEKNRGKREHVLNSGYSFVRQADDERQTDDQRGCLNRNGAQMQCHISSKTHKINCCYEQLCNHEINITLPGTV